MEEAPFEFPVDGVLDLHSFDPADLKELLPHYLSLCKDKGIYQVRIIHGKGTGTLRESVHAILRRMGDLVSFSLADNDAGGWGATIVILKK